MKKQFYHILRGVRNRHVLVFDVLMFCLIPTLAMLLRMESMEESGRGLMPLAFYTSLSLLWKLSVFYPSGLYTRYWRYASVDELATVVYANLISGVIGVVVFFGILMPSGILQGFPRSIPFIDGLLTLMVVGGFRFLLRVGSDYNEHAEGMEGHSTKKKKALIVGAGVAGSMILKELKMNPNLPLEPVGFLDDDPEKQHVFIHGVPVIGMLQHLPSAVEDHGVEEVIIAMPTSTGRTIRQVVKMCQEAKVPSKTIPGIFEILGGSAKVSQFRDIDIEDLLRRGVVKTDTDGVANLLKGARVMVTGAGGSIGSELCRQIRNFEPDEIILLGHGENSIFSIARELKFGDVGNVNQYLRPLKVQTVIADVRDRERMRQVFQRHRPEVVFHAAAHKHVGLMEENIPDAVTNNVLGTQVLVETARQFNVERFVMISSDKAVNPTCIMGVTKRIAELVVHDAAERSNKHFVSVRFGNVLGSRGSVVPIFKQQIAQGGPVTITHPDVERFFMTIPEAVQLVLQAATMGEGGEVFVLDMGDPIKVVDLARDLIRLSGLEEGKDIEIIYTGLQRGEKMSESLFFEAEKVESSNHEKILVCRNGFKKTTERTEDSAHLFAMNPRKETAMRPEIKRLIEAAQNGAINDVRVIMNQIVPEYTDSSALPEIETKSQAEIGISPAEPALKEANKSVSLVEAMDRS